MSDELKSSSDFAKNLNEKNSEDDDLDELLDNALQDFDKHAQLQAQPLPSSSENSVKSKEELTRKDKPTEKSSSNDGVEENPDLMDPMTFSEDSIMKLMSQFEQTVQSILTDGVGEDEGVVDEFTQQFSKDFKKIAEDTMKGLTEESGTSESEIASTITETLNNLSENAGSLQGNENNLLNMLEILGIEGGEGSDGMPVDFTAMFNNIMRLFLSKDILYPSLKELVTKYPEWLEENKSSISKEDYTRYSKQLEIMIKICSEMESATDSDDCEVKSKRFSKVLELMQQMQECGNPPKGLIGVPFSDFSDWM